MKKCTCCKGKDGKRKEVYENPQAAYDAAKHIENSRGMLLTVYKCPQGNGWHLTKSDESLEISDIGIPLAAPDGSWKFISDTAEAGNTEGKASGRKPKNQYAIPIKRIECRSEADLIEISGKVTDIIANADIEKIFGISLQNPFCANMVKNLAGGPVTQITVLAENSKHNRLDSYTVLLKSDLIKSKKIKIGNEAAIKISGMIVNNVKAWRLQG